MTDFGADIFDSDALGKRVNIQDPASEFEIQLPLAKRSGMAEVEVALAYFYCQENSQALCKVGNVTWTTQVKLSDRASTNRVVLKHSVP